MSSMVVVGEGLPDGGRDAPFKASVTPSGDREYLLPRRPSLQMALG